MECENWLQQTNIQGLVLDHKIFCLAGGRDMNSKRHSMVTNTATITNILPISHH